MTWPAYVVWFVIVASALSSGPLLLYVFQVVVIFGTLQMIPGGDGSFNFLPGAICASFLVAKTLLQRGNFVQALALAVNPFRAGLFGAFVLYGILTCFVLPKLFAGMLVVVPVNAFGADVLYPTSANFTQISYTILSFLTTLCFGVLTPNSSFRRHYLIAVLVGSAAVVASGLIDLVLFRTGHSNLLDPIRTTSYRLLADGEIAGSKRLVGFTAEASSYGSLCIGALSTLVFLRPFYSAVLRRIIVPAIIGLLLLMAIFSTSSNAYAGLAVLSAVYSVSLLLRLSSSDSLMREGLWAEFCLIGCVTFGLLAVAVFAQDVLRPVYHLFDLMVLRKSSSESYIERGMWTQTAIGAFLDSGGVGVGIGSVRTSNWFVSIVTSAGVFGSALLFGFIVFLLTGKGDMASLRLVQMRRGIRFAVIPTIAMSALGGTIPDIGVHTASLYGLLVGLQFAPSRSSAQSHVGLTQPVVAVSTI